MDFFVVGVESARCNVSFLLAPLISSLLSLLLIAFVVPVENPLAPRLSFHEISVAVVNSFAYVSAFHLFPVIEPVHTHVQLLVQLAVVVQLVVLHLEVVVENE